eukprot:GHVU01044939.1.p1 GENE.GHVU01044939.1~~GHVU01044939.1.p1  ORF type:complete len:113 (-),score=21.07 GHVU01044939.1:223-561(-)
MALENMPGSAGATNRKRRRKTQEEGAVEESEEESEEERLSERSRIRKPSRPWRGTAQMSLRGPGLDGELASAMFEHLMQRAQESTRIVRACLGVVYPDDVDMGALADDESEK